MRMRQWMEKMDSRLERIERDLAEHMRRSLSNEEANRMTREHLELARKELEPLKMHVAAWAGVAKAATVLGALAAAAVSIAKLLGKI